MSRHKTYFPWYFTSSCTEFTGICFATFCTTFVQKNHKFGTCCVSARNDNLGILLSGPPSTYIRDGCRYLRTCIHVFCPELISKVCICMSFALAGSSSIMAFYWLAIAILLHKMSIIQSYRHLRTVVLRQSASVRSVRHFLPQSAVGEGGSLDFPTWVSTARLKRYRAESGATW